MGFTQVDFVIAFGIFMIFTVFLLNYVTSYLTNYRSLTETSEMREVASSLFNTFFTGKGIPSDWEKKGINPVKLGLMDYLYLIIINVTETNGTYRENIVINGSVDFDPSCEKNILNNTVRLYFEDELIPFQLYNQTFCNDSLKRADIVFNLTLQPYESKFFFLYFSSQESVIPPNYSVQFPQEAKNYTFETYPIQEMQMISVDKLKVLRNLDYEILLQTLPRSNFRVEIG